LAILLTIIAAWPFVIQAGAIGTPYQYSQFYSMTSGTALSNAISTPQQIAIAGNTPTHVYLGETMQSVSYTQYQSTPSSTGGNSLWIKGTTAWTQYAVVPQGATISLLEISSAGGTGSITLDGQTYGNSYTFYPNGQFTLNTGTTGRHIVSYSINGWESNQIVIDVVAGESYSQPTYYPRYYYPGYDWSYPWIGYPSYKEAANPPQNPPKNSDPVDKDKKPEGKPGEKPVDKDKKPEGKPGEKPVDKDKKPEGKPGENHESTPSENPGTPGTNSNPTENPVSSNPNPSENPGTPGTNSNPTENPVSSNPNPSENSRQSPSGAIRPNPSPSTNPTDEPSGMTIPGAENGSGHQDSGQTHQNGNQGTDRNRCDSGYHLENGKCVPD